MKKKLILLSIILTSATGIFAANKYDNPDTIVVARDGTGEFRTIAEAVEVCRAFMEYHKVIYVKKGTYKEKLIIPQWLTNIEILGEDRDATVITYDDHANIVNPLTGKGIGTFRTYTVKVEGSSITFKNITIENNSARLGQAVALHTEGDRLVFINCRLLGHQDTVYTGIAGTRLLFKNCYIEGTTDFIFGPSTAWFENCEIRSRANSYITAASTPQDRPYGYVFNNCRLTADEGIDKVYLGRPWRDYGHTVFMNCEMGSHIRPEGWHHWQKERQQTARQQRGPQQREGHQPERGETVGTQVHRRLLQAVAGASEPGDDVVEHRDDAEGGVGDHQRQEAELHAEHRPESVVERDPGDDPGQRDRKDDQQRHGVPAEEPVALQRERGHRAQDQGDGGGDQADDDAGPQRVERAAVGDRPCPPGGGEVRRWPAEGVVGVERVQHHHQQREVDQDKAEHQGGEQQRSGGARSGQGGCSSQNVTGCPGRRYGERRTGRGG